MKKVVLAYSGGLDTSCAVKWLGEQHEMVVNITPAAAAGFLFQPRTRRDVNLAADDRLHAFVACLFVKIHHAMHRAVVGDGERGKFQLVRLLRQFVQTASAIE